MKPTTYIVDFFNGQEVEVTVVGSAQAAIAAAITEHGEWLGDTTAASERGQHFQCWVRIGKLDD